MDIYDEPNILYKPMKQIPLGGQPMKPVYGPLPKLSPVDLIEEEDADTLPVEPDPIGLLRTVERHRAYVQDALECVADALTHRGRLHDLSKLGNEEFEGFSRINAIARKYRFGSKEYDDAMESERDTIDLHFKNNSHHAEFHDQTFLDIIEMVCDWYGASQGYADPRPWHTMFSMNMEKKGKYMSPWQKDLAIQVSRFFMQGDIKIPLMEKKEG